MDFWNQKKYLCLVVRSLVIGMSTLSASSNFGFKPIYAGVSALGQAVSFNALHVAVSTVTGAGALGVEEALGGMVFHAGTGGDLTVPTAASLVAAMPGCTVGTAFDLYVRVTASAPSTLTTSTGITLSGDDETAAGGFKVWRFVVTDNRIGSEAITAYVVGAGTF
jgi:hypothetical protein